MLTIKGQSISGLIAIAPLHVFHPFTPDVTRKEIKDTDTEVSRFITARDTASTIMQKLHDQALSTSGADNAAIFENYRQLLAAPEFTNQTTGIIRSQKVNFEYAVKQVEENYRQILASDNAAYASSSMADFSVVVNAVIEALQSGVQRDTLTGPCILASHDLTPEQTIRFDKSKLLGFVTVDGNSLSHTAILARSLGVPAILATGHEIGDELDGHPAIIDGFTGTVYVDPTPEIIQEMKQKQADHKAQRELLEELRGLPAETEDGRRVEISANISSAGDLAAVIKNDAESIGLFRSEFIYMGRDTLPTEEEQFKIYKLAAETMAGKGSEIGGSFQELRRIIDGVELQEKLGICLDTCHVSDGGYDIAGRLDQVLEEFDHVIGLSRLKAVHLNDSLNPLGSHKDRHANIGKGTLGLQAFERMINHPVLRDLPFYLETPNDDDGHGEEIALLKSLYHGS